MSNGREVSTKENVICEFGVLASSLSTAVTVMIGVLKSEDCAMVTNALQRENNITSHMHLYMIGIRR